ncbi:hypothetical protein VNO77_39112 [Canavalia gladiata]|uniref:Uncharacterized protein n=1 Tax=Canavalia gladiata TaxID=3824 RepID=A0AAN9PXH6_CANGL
MHIILCETPWTKSVVGLGNRHIVVLGNCPELDMLDSVEEVGVNTVLTYQNKRLSFLITYKPEYLKVVVIDSHSLTAPDTVAPYKM